MYNFIKKVLAVLVIVLFTGFLTGCGEADTDANQNLQVYEGGEFVINIDPSWKIINQSDF